MDSSETDSVSSWPAGNVQLVFNDGKFSLLNTVVQAQGSQDTSNDMGGTSVVEAGQALGGVSQDIQDVGDPLLAALNAMGSLKARVFDSHNHNVQTELLKLVEKANGSGEEANVAKMFLAAVAQNGTIKPLLTRALASTMGGAPWVKGKKGMASAANAAKTLLALSDGETPLLKHDDCKAIRRQCDNHDVFSNKDAPIFGATQSLSIEQRVQLGDCFGKYPRDVYEKRREYSELKEKIEILKRKIADFSCGKKDMLELYDDFKISLESDIEKNGFNIPQGFERPLTVPIIPEGAISKQETEHAADDKEFWDAWDKFKNDPDDATLTVDDCRLCLEHQEALALTNLRRTAKAATNINRFLDAWDKFQVDNNDSNLTVDDHRLCASLREAQGLFGGNNETVASSEEKTKALEDELNSRDPNLTRRYSLAEEDSSRRDFMAGKPNATLGDCWNAITSSDERFEMLGDYDARTTFIKRGEAQLDQVKRECERLCRPDTFPPEEGTQLAEQLKTLAMEHRQDNQKLIALASFLNGLGYSLDEVSQGRTGNPLSLISETMQLLLAKTVLSVSPGHESDLPESRIDLGQSIKNAEKFLHDHSDIAQTTADQIREILAIAREVKTNG
jgi:hypothetical protein